MYNDKKGLAAAASAALAALYLFFAIILARSGRFDLALLYPGRFLYQYYLDSAFYVPIYLAVCAFFLVWKKFHRDRAIILILTIFPFLTAGLALRLANNAENAGLLEKALSRSFGTYSPVIVFLVAAVEILLIVKAALYLSSLRKRPAEGESGDQQDQETATGGERADTALSGAGGPSGQDAKAAGKSGETEADGSVKGAESVSPAGSGFAELKLSVRPQSADDAEDEVYDEPAIYRLEGNNEGSGEITETMDQSGPDGARPGEALPRQGETGTAAEMDDIDEGRGDAAGRIIYPGEARPDDEDDYPADEEFEDEIYDADGEAALIVPEGGPVRAGMNVFDVEDETIAPDEGNGGEDIAGSGEAYSADVSAGMSVGLPLNGTDGEADAKSDTGFFASGEKPYVVKEYFAAQKKINQKKKEYKIPFDILDEYEETAFSVIDTRTREEAEILRQTLAEFRIEAEVTGIRKGPVITMFEILPAPGVKLSRITNLADNIALRLAASRVRIVAPIPGKHAVGIEVPNRHRAIVSFRELIEVDYPQYAKYHLPIVLGKDITGGEQIIDLTQTPHLLIAGATGSGKSVCVNSIIASLLYKRKPQDVRMILIDPKIVELKLYNDIPHLLTPVITDPKKAFQALQYCIYEMEKRYALLDALGVRDIHSFNRKIKSRNVATLPLPYIVVIVDEFADLMATTGKELESTLARLAAMSRAVGIHLVLATQRPSIDVITGLIKANIPSRIAFMVASKTDSRIIIDSVGSEMLLGKGDMLFTSAWNPYLTRIQGAYLSESEAERVAEKVREYGEPEYIDDEIFIDDEEDDGFSDFENEYGEDPLMEKALEIVASAGKASASYLQRRLKIGYNRAARLVEEMERRGIVGPQNGSKPRDILNIPGSHREL